MKSGRLKLNLFALQSMTGNVLFLVENTKKYSLESTLCMYICEMNKTKTTTIVLVILDMNDFYFRQHYSQDTFFHSFQFSEDN